MTSTAAATAGVRDALIAAVREELIERGRASISLRAVARRAGVSHAAPTYFFGDKAGMLTVLAADGFRQLTAALQAVRAADGPKPLAAVGHVYIDFGLQNPAMFDLMFSPSELRTDDTDLMAAQHAAISELTAAVTEITQAGTSTLRGAPQMSLISWALAHGLVVLARDGALQAATGAPDAEAAAAVARELTDVFDARVTTT